MRKFMFSVAFAGLGVVGMVAQAAAQTTTTATVGYTVEAIDEISATGNATLLIASSADYTGTTANSTDNTVALTVTTNGLARKITAHLSAAMPTGLTLEATAASFAGGTSTGAKVLGVAATGTAANPDLITGIEKNTGSGSVTFSLKADATAAATTGQESRTVTFTLVAAA